MDSLDCSTMSSVQEDQEGSLYEGELSEVLNFDTLEAFVVSENIQYSSYLSQTCPPVSDGSSVTGGSSVIPGSTDEQDDHRVQSALPCFSCHRRWTAGLAVFVSIALISVIASTVVVLTKMPASREDHKSVSLVNDPSPPNALISKEGEEALMYLRKLRQQVLGSQFWIFFDVGAPQLLATEWMAYIDSPRRSLNDSLLEQRYALLVLFYEFGIDHLAIPGENECLWRNIGCDDNDVVKSFNYVDETNDDLCLAGTVVEEIGLLSSLEFLHLANNEIKGSLPLAMFSLTNLVYIDISYNRFVGQIPTAIGSLTNLQMLSISNNILSGTLPQNLRLLKDISTFIVSYNMFEGEVWSFFSFWPKLEIFSIDNTNLGGTIPTDIAKLSNLIAIELSNTATYGQIPTEIGLVTKLRTFISNVAPLVGQLPSEIGLLTSLDSLVIRDAQFYGTTIPTEIGLCSNLRFLALEFLELVGTLPTELGSLSDLTFISTYDNKLVGTIPSQLEAITTLVSIHIDCNQLTGTLPSGLCKIGNHVTLPQSVICRCCDGVILPFWD